MIIVMIVVLIEVSSSRVQVCVLCLYNVCFIAVQDLCSIKNIGPRYLSGNTEMVTKQVTSRIYISFMFGFAPM